VPTLNRQVSVKVSLSVPGEEQKVTFVGFDPENNTKYFERSPRISGSATYFFSLPHSPRYLHLSITSPVKFSKPDITLIPLITNLDEISYTDRVNVRFIENFSLNVSRYKANRIYKSAGCAFEIQLLPIIKVNGVRHPTPARIHKTLNHIQVSKSHFDKMTFPMRVAILLHEYSHNFVNEYRDNEKEADFHAMNIYSLLGYPYSEAVKAYARIFSDTDINFQRLDSIYVNLKSHYNNSII
jgi:hypothetical protein